MNPPASTGITQHSDGASPSREGAQSRPATQGIELEGKGKGVPESQSQTPVVWWLAWEPWGLLGRSQEERTE